MIFKNGDTLERTDSDTDTFARVIDTSNKGFTLRDDEGLPKMYLWQEAHLWKKKL